MRIIALLAIAVCSFVLGSCATVSQAQNQCSAFGFTPGTDAYASCVQQQYQSNRADFQQRLLNASRIANESTPSYQPTYGSTASGSGFLKSSYVSGMNRVCVYNRLGSDYVVTIGSTEICPLSAP